jgi:hypothetical protein
MRFIFAPHLTAHCTGARIQFRASKSWTCDISTAVAGETVILFVTNKENTPEILSLIVASGDCLSKMILLFYMARVCHRSSFVVTCVVRPRVPELQRYASSITAWFDYNNS